MIFKSAMLNDDFSISTKRPDRRAYRRAYRRARKKTSTSLDETTFALGGQKKTVNVLAEIWLVFGCIGTDFYALWSICGDLQDDLGEF